ncbi:MAG: aminotransferase class IV [Bacteroidales bacterium]|nr:aminotransferase class IV [Bacteroidales bacterium]
MSQFIESIRILNGTIELSDYHNDRFNATRKSFFCVDEDIDLVQCIAIPKAFRKGLVKCRVLYDLAILDMQFVHYQAAPIRTLQLVDASVNYAYKFANREQLNALKAKANSADEVLIVNNGKVSDTSFSNILFYKNGHWFTPDSPLLAGVQREFLLNRGQIEELRISPQELSQFESFMLINAMLPFDESRALPIQNILS